MKLHRHAPVLLLAAGLAAGCADLLPKASNEVSSGWKSFEEARAAIEAIEPGRTTAADLRRAGLDPYATQNVQLLTYSDIALRFPITGPVADEGLRKCLQAGKACTGYAISAKDIKRDRIGNFWKDSLGFRRVTEIRGWTFNALILMVNDHVVYTLYGGQPNVHEQEVTRQPLGPVQNFGESMGSLVR